MTRSKDDKHNINVILLQGTDFFGTVSAFINFTELFLTNDISVCSNILYYENGYFIYFSIVINLLLYYKWNIRTSKLRIMEHQQTLQGNAMLAIIIIKLNSILI